MNEAQEAQPSVESHPRRRSLEEWLYDALGTQACGNTCAPGDWMKMPGGLNESTPIVSVGEDGFTLWLGGVHVWQFSMSRVAARKLALWVLFRWWIGAEWFGLRRWAWYKLLHRRCARYSWPSDD